MLDDLKFIHDKDAQDALGIAEKQGEQLAYDFKATVQPQSDHVFNVVVGGMGGSALSALVLQVWPGIGEPFEVVRGYDLPAYVDGDTLFIASSYSGNTEETISALDQAEAKGAQVAIVASGGKLEERASAKNHPFYKLPTGLQPRHAVWYSYKALLQILVDYKVLPGLPAELAPAATKLKAAIANWRPDVPTAQNPAKQLAQELMGKSPVIYGGSKLWPAAYKWKISFNENAKNVAWSNAFPEFNHNEFLGWVSHPVDKPYGIVELQSNLEHERIQKRFDISNRLLSGKWPNPHIVKAEGDNLFEQLLWTIAFGDFVSLYVALLNGLNPTPVDLIEKLKTELNN